MNIPKELVFREFDDKGAETFEKHWAQIEYTAYLCSLMLSPNSGILGIIPEGVEDVCVVRDNFYELHQVKCRDESQPPWTTAEIIPILCKLYHHRLATKSQCDFHFVSDHYADAKTQLKPNTYGALARLKQILDIKHAGYDLLPNEIKEYAELESILVERITNQMLEDYGEIIDEFLAKELISRTHIKTHSRHIRNYLNYEELAELMCQAFPGQIAPSVPHLHNFYLRVLLLIARKIISSGDLEQRKISRDEVLNCRYESNFIEYGLPDLDNLPGITVAEKKAYYGGFSIDEFPVFAKQRLHSVVKRRRLETLGLGDQVTDLSLSLITLHHRCRREISNRLNYRGIGPELLRSIENGIPECIQNHFHNNEIDMTFCHGLIWQETNECTLWWHRLSETNGVDDGESSSLK